MNVTIAIDSLKGSLSSMEAGHAIEEGIRRVYKNASVNVRPLADGGEGTVEALACGMGGRLETVTVTGPLGAPVECQYGILPESGTAIIEMSGAAGITLVPDAEKDPMKTTTFGVGQVIRSAIQKGCRRFIVGIGGSATNDGGTGMLQALGYGILDRDGNQIPPGAQGLAQIASISSEHVLPELSECTFRIACDVNNPLCGPRGASAVYGPQKGADEAMVQVMDRGLAHFAEIAGKWNPKADPEFPGTDEAMVQVMDRGLAHFAEIAGKWNPKADPEFPGTGAAGGLGFAFLTFTSAVLESGIQIVLEETRLREYVKDADLVITGEGRLDGQTVMGKAPVGVARIAKEFHKPVLAFSGSVTREAAACNDAGIDAFFPILRSVVTLEEAMDPENARKNMADTAEQIFRLIQAVQPMQAV